VSGLKYSLNDEDDPDGFQLWAWWEPWEA